MKMLNNVLIKLIRGGFTDRVLFIDNVPEEMFYEMQYPRKCEGVGQAQHYVADTSKPKVPTLYGELSESQTGDKGIVFNLENENAKNRYLALDRYIKSVYPNSKVPAEPIVNSLDPMDSSAPALALSQVPRVVLPALSPVGGTTASSNDAPALDVDEIKKQAVEEYKKAKEDEVKERMASARAARNVKSA
jgi:hypothetical protein